MSGHRGSRGRQKRGSRLPDRTWGRNPYTVLSVQDTDVSSPSELQTNKLQAGAKTPDDKEQPPCRAFTTPANNGSSNDPMNLAEKLAQARRIISVLDGRLIEVERESTEKVQTLESKLASLELTHKQRLDTMERKLIAAESKAAAAANSNDSSRERIAQLEKQYQSALETAANAQTDAATATDRNTKFRKRIGQLVEQLSEEKKKVDRVKSEASAREHHLQRQLAERNLKITQAKAEMKRHIQELNRIDGSWT